MKILYIGNFTKWDSPLGYCPNALYIANSFRELGHVITEIDESESTTQDILKIINNYDFILTEEARLKDDFKNDEKNKKDVLLGLFKEVMDKSEIPIVSWMTNIFWGIMRRQDQVKYNPIFKADIVFTTDGGHQKEFESEGVNHHLLRQGIYEPEAYIGNPTYPTNAEIVFVGAIYDEIHPYRKKLIEFLKETYGTKFEHLGQRGDIRHEDLNNLCATVKIVVGDSVYSPYYWSNRIYEIIGRGGFFIHPDVAGLSDEFIPYKHFIPYQHGNLSQLKIIIDYYLSHEKERKTIQMAGFNYCKKNHTYLIRVKEMLRVLKENGIVK